MKLDSTKEEIAVFLESILRKVTNEDLIAYEASGIL